MHGQPIGTLSLLAGDQSIFAFDETYILDRERPMLSLSFKDTTGGLITDVKPTRVRVPVTLSPAYDFMSTIPYIDDLNMALNLYKPGTKRMTDLVP